MSVFTAVEKPIYSTGSPGKRPRPQQLRPFGRVALGENGNFLERFKAYGWHLDDLVLTPVNKLTKSQRRAKCLEAKKSLADRIAAYQPEAIVSLLMFIKPFVDAAAITAGSNAHRYAVPFPGMGHQGASKPS